MNKSKVKNTYDPIRAIAVKETATLCGCTEQYVRQVISSNKDTGRADGIRRTYLERYAAYTSVKSL